MRLPVAEDAAVGVNRGSKADRAYEVIRSKIIDGTFGPGYRLVLERLAGEMGVSAVPVREALRKLEAEGYVDFKANIGATVSVIDPVAYAETMQTLAALEGMATALAAPMMSKRDMRAARKANDAIAVSLRRLDPIEYSSRSEDFHAVLRLPCPNSHLRELIEREWTRLRGVRHSSIGFIPERARQSVAEHTRLLDLIEKDATAAKIEDYARAHRMRTAELILQRYAQIHGPTTAANKAIMSVTTGDRGRALIR
jgi:DNA-binding GntR family transcriptional regulator